MSDPETPSNPDPEPERQPEPEPELEPGAIVLPETPATDTSGTDKGGSSDGKRLLIALGVLFVVAVAAIAIGVSRSSKSNTAATTTSTAAAGGADSTTDPAAGCAKGAWPGLYIGKPTSLGTETGPTYFVWWDALGWHVRVSNVGKTPGPGFSGTVTSSARIVQAAPNPLNSGTVKITGNRADFSFDNVTDPVGFDLKLSCDTTSIRFGLMADNKPADPNHIRVGVNGTGVDSAFTVNRLGS